MECILYTELVKSILCLCIARICEGRSRNFSTSFYFSSQQSSRNFLDFFQFFRAVERWKFLDLFSISPCDEETEIS